MNSGCYVDSFRRFLKPSLVIKCRVLNLKVFDNMILGFPRDLVRTFKTAINISPGFTKMRHLGKTSAVREAKTMRYRLVLGQKSSKTLVSGMKFRGPASLALLVHSWVLNTVSFVSCITWNMILLLIQFRKRNLLKRSRLHNFFFLYFNAFCAFCEKRIHKGTV